MSTPAVTYLIRRTRQARQRIFVQSLLNRLTVCWLTAVVLSLGWFLLAPLFWVDQPSAVRWWVAGSLVGAGTLFAVITAIRSVPTSVAVALELDRRFGLAERVSTVASLTEDERETSAGRALILDADTRLRDVRVGTGFPVRLGWLSFLVPVGVAGLVAVALFYNPIIPGATASQDDPDGTIVATNDPEKSEANQKKPVIPPFKEREGKSEELKNFEDELRQLMEEANRPDVEPEKAREKVRQADELKKDMDDFATKQAQKFNALQKQLKSMEEMKEQKPFEKGPGEELHDALAQRDLNRAQDEVDRLRKKLEDGALSEEESNQLREQLKEMQERLERAAEQEDRKKELEELIKQAKEEGRDADSLERELKRLEAELAQNSELSELADKIGQVRKALESEDLEKAVEEMQKIAGQLDQWSEELQDLESLEEHLQRLKSAREGLCKQCQGQGEGEGESDKPGQGLGRGRGAGERPDNPDAVTDSEDQRVRATFRPWGRKLYGGSTDGPAFTKRSTVELEGEIQEAVQTAPEATEVQRLPRETQDMVREYFEKLGGQQK